MQKLTINVKTITWATLIALSLLNCYALFHFTRQLFHLLFD